MDKREDYGYTLTALTKQEKVYPPNFAENFLANLRVFGVSWGEFFAKTSLVTD
jgi:hypothetical protein